MMSMAGASSIDALTDPLSIVVRIMSVKAGTISLSAETRLTIGSISAEVMTGTSGTVTVVAYEATAVGTNSIVLGSDVEV